MGSAPGPAPSLGPVFEYEWLTATRRWQGYALRSVFVLLLLTALIVTRSSRTNDLTLSTIRNLAETGRQFYAAVIGTELTLVLLAAPAATAGAICIDKARGTLTHLLVTDLTDAEIVLGKLAARLVPVLGLVACSLPVVSLLTLLGGVDPDAMLGAFAVTVGVALLGCALALVFSLWAGKTHEALLGTYAVLGLWLLSGSMVPPLNMAFGLALPGPASDGRPVLPGLCPLLASESGRLGRLPDISGCRLSDRRRSRSVRGPPAPAGLHAGERQEGAAWALAARPGYLEGRGSGRPARGRAGPVARREPGALARVAPEPAVGVDEGRRGVVRHAGDDLQRDLGGLSAR